MGDAPVAHSPCEDQALAEVRAVAATELFQRSPRLRALLLFLGERTASGEHDRLSEYEIGREVFQRGPDWVPTDDSIVRSSVRQLRLKLAEYYSQDGARSPCPIEIPKGLYAVSLRHRETPEALAPVVVEGPVRRRPSWLAIALAVLLCGSVALNLVLIRARGTGASERPLGLAAALATQSQQPTRIVLDDFAYVLLRQIADSTEHDVEDYARRGYTAPSLAPSTDPHLLKLWNLLGTRHIVSLGAAATLDRLLRSTPDPSRMVLAHARNMTTREFQNGNSIIVGSLPNNPWSDMFEQGLHFERVATPDGRVTFVNKNPKPGEQAEYAISQNAAINSGVGYARVAYVSNRSSGFVLLLNGVNMVTTEAAGDFATDPARLLEICRLFGVASVRDLPHLELLLRTTALDNTVRGASVIAWRRLE